MGDQIMKECDEYWAALIDTVRGGYTNYGGIMWEKLYRSRVMRYQLHTMRIEVEGCILPHQQHPDQLDELVSGLVTLRLNGSDVDEWLALATKWRMQR